MTETSFSLLRPKSNVKNNIPEGESPVDVDREERKSLTPRTGGEPVPDGRFKEGKRLPSFLRKKFPVKYQGKPLEDIDEFYKNRNTFVVIGKGLFIYRFSTSDVFFLFNPFHPLRRIALFILVHPLFNLFVTMTILINCVFMTMVEYPVFWIEYIFVACYTVEGMIKVLSRGLILNQFTYLRDPWNWLDFAILICAYLSLWFELGSISAMRIFRVLRILKTFVYIQGLRAVAGALLDAIRRLRDVIVLAVLMISIFAIVGTQLYMGTLRHKCITFENFNVSLNHTEFKDKWFQHIQNTGNWYYTESGQPLMCGNGTGAGNCPSPFFCIKGTNSNPNSNFTHFDNFGGALLSSFRLIAQDFWENLYKLIIRANGTPHFFFFLFIIILGSFYLINLIIAIVAVSFIHTLNKDKQQQEDEKDDENEQSNIDAGINHPADQNTEVADIEEKGKNENDSKGLNNPSKVFRCIRNCQIWRKFQNMIALVIFDPFAELFVMFIIAMNTLFMAIDRHNKSKHLEDVLDYGNYFFFSIFVLEAVLKIVALGPLKYITNRWNSFDFIVVVCSSLEFVFVDISGFSILRSFRLFRIFKLAKSWHTFNRLLRIMSNTMTSLCYLLFVQMIVIFTFAVMGFHLFRDDYFSYYTDEMPRWNFTDFFHSFLVVFRVLCGEWIESMWLCWSSAGPLCLVFFISTYLVGNLVVLNLFLAMLLNAFDSESLTISMTDDSENTNMDMHVIIDRFRRLLKWSKMKVCRERKSKDIYQNEIELQQCEMKRDNEIHQNITNSGNKETETLSKPSNIPIADCDTAGSGRETPPNCGCHLFLHNCVCCMEFQKSMIGRMLGRFRTRTKTFVTHKYFERFILAIIISNSIALALEDIHLKERPHLARLLKILDIFYTVIFGAEMLLKWTAFGFKKYFKNAWSWIDFIIVIVSIAMLCLERFGQGSFHAFRALRSFRVLRPLSAISRFPSMKVVVITLLKSIPSIANVLMVCLLVWIIFGILGVQLFAGKFYKCVDSDGNKLSTNLTANKTECLSKNHTWENSRINFDDVPQSLLALLQVATYKGWIEVMNDAIDSTEIDEQPEREANVYMYLYFVAFIVLCSFVTLNLFVGVIIDNFTRKKKKAEGYSEAFLTESQKKQYETVKKLKTKAQDKNISPPTNKLLIIMFNITKSPKFEIGILIVIFLNMITIAVEHYNQPDVITTLLAYSNQVFVVIFLIEFLVKILGLRQYYFKIPWNVFDFVLVILSIIGRLSSK
ncbi:sodium channel protein para-like isoform X2 [Saccostrea cucullata]|uniref:sodium channel protein para-like isoform X2 n=1 Tax=Saccostrea cuccullata TaxID=36930 RepID=UPI002ED5AA08